MLHYGYEDLVQLNRSGTSINDAVSNSTPVWISQNFLRGRFQEFMESYDRFKVDAVTPFLVGGSDEQENVSFPEEDSCNTPYTFARVGGEFSNGAYWTGANVSQNSGLSKLHAPVPLPGRAPFPRTRPCHSEGYLSTASVGYPTTHPLLSQYHTKLESYPYLPAQLHDYNHFQSHPAVVSPQSTFPTPSELLIQLSNQDDDHTPRSPRSDLGRSRTLERPSRSEVSNCTAVGTATPLDSSFLAPLTHRTSQESITSHEKKRHYLECLEHYVETLHEHFHFLGLEPAPLERITHSGGLDSRSIRVSTVPRLSASLLILVSLYSQSLLIHMEKLNKQLKEQVFKEEERVSSTSSLHACRQSHV